MALFKLERFETNLINLINMCLNRKINPFEMTSTKVTNRESESEREKAAKTLTIQTQTHRDTHNQADKQTDRKTYTDNKADTNILK